MPRHLTARVLAFDYVILDSPEPLTDDAGIRCKAHIDHAQRTIWIDPAVAAASREQLLVSAVARAWAERLREAPLVGSSW